MIDIARELNRYMQRYAGRDRQSTAEIKDALGEKFSAALRGECGA